MTEIDFDFSADEEDPYAGVIAMQIAEGLAESPADVAERLADYRTDG